MTKDIYLAIPSWATLYHNGDHKRAFVVTAFQFDYTGKFSMHEENGELLVACHIRGERKALREEMRFIYGFEPRTIVR